MPKTAAAGTYKLIACVGKACATGATVTVKGAAARRAARPAVASLGRHGEPPAGPAPAAERPGTTRRPRRPRHRRPRPDARPDPARDPKDAAPPLDPGAATSVYDSTKFLYSGANPIQRDVEPGAIERQAGRGPQGPRPGPRRRADRAACASPCSTTPSSARPTRAPTARSTSPSTAAASRSQFVRRRLPAGPAHARAGLAGLRDARRRRDGPGRPERQDDRPGLHRAVPGRAAAPRPRTRTASARARCCSRRASTARWSSPNGRTKPLDELKVRVTEFTYGEQGDEAMPGSLPANSGYTYAAEFSVDEALKAGATQVNFDKPLINYTENFIGAPVGSAVPTGYYDRETAEWKAREERPRHQGPLRGRRHRGRRHRRRRQGRHRPRHDRRRAQAARAALRARPGAVARR